MPKVIDISNLVISQPLPASHTYHVFDRSNGNRSLCGKYGIIRMDEVAVEKVNGEERWINGQDCKSCFKKAGLKVV